MGKNKIITSQGNVQFINSRGKTINMHPMHCYAVYENDTVSFLFIYMKEYSGQAFFASQFEDLEVNGESYDSLDELKDAINYAFAKAGAQARTEIVDELPEDPFTNTIYLIKKEHGEGYDEYIWNEDEGWQLIGDTDIEFERYLKIDDFNPYSAATKDYIDAVSANTVQNASDIQFLSGAVDTEISDREAADTALSGAIDTVAADLVTESQRAISAETQLQNSINTVNGRVDAEQIARAQADTALSGAIDTVVSNLANEVSARTAADEALDSKIDTVSGDVISETSRAEGAEIALGGRIDNEITARTSADTALQTAINNEASARTDADSALSDAIDSVDSKVDTLSGEVETMGDEAIVDAAYVSSATTIEFYNASGDVVASIDATDFIKDGMIEDVRIENGYLIIDFNTESGIHDIEIPLTDIFNPDNYYDKTAVDGLLADKADLSALTEDERVLGEALNDLNSRVDTISGDVASKFDASGITAYSTSQEVTAEIEAAVSGKAENSDLVALSGEVATLSGNAITSGDVQNQIDAAVSGKQDTLSAGTNITIVDNVISAEGGGKAIEAGRGISITTGETADTISFSLPIYSGKTGLYWDPTYNNNSIVLFDETAKADKNSISAGYGSEALGKNSFAFGIFSKTTTNNSFALGSNIMPKNNNEFSVGCYNNSVTASTEFGDSGNTLFSVGNGTADNARHNALEIRQNGDIYLNDGTNDVKLQDTITATASNTTALGGLSLVKLTQAEYDALVTKDSNTLYIISD